MSLFGFSRRDSDVVVGSIALGAAVEFSVRCGVPGLTQPTGPLGQIYRYRDRRGERASLFVNYCSPGWRDIAGAAMSEIASLAASHAPVIPRQDAAEQKSKPDAQAVAVAKQAMNQAQGRGMRTATRTVRAASQWTRRASTRRRPSLPRPRLRRPRQQPGARRWQSWSESGRCCLSPGPRLHALEPVQPRSPSTISSSHRLLLRRVPASARMAAAARVSSSMLPRRPKLVAIAPTTGGPIRKPA